MRFPEFRRQEEYKAIGAVPMQERPSLSPLQGVGELGQELVQEGQRLQQQQIRAHRAASMVESTAKIVDIQTVLEREITEGKWPDAEALKNTYNEQVTEWMDQVDPETRQLIEPEINYRKNMAWYDLEKSQFLKRGEIEKTRLAKSLDTIGVSAMNPKNTWEQVQELVDGGVKGIDAMPDAWYRGGALEKQETAEKWKDTVWGNWFQAQVEKKTAPEALRQALEQAQLTPEARAKITEGMQKYEEDFIREGFFQVMLNDPHGALAALETAGLDAETTFKLREYGKNIIELRENQARYKKKLEEEALTAIEEKKLYSWMRDAELETDPVRRMEGLLRVRTEADLLLKKGSVNQSVGMTIFNHTMTLLEEMQRQQADLTKAQTAVGLGLLPQGKSEVDALYGHELQTFLQTPGEKNLEDFQLQFIDKTGKFSSAMEEEIKSAVGRGNPEMLQHYNQLLMDLQHRPAGRMAWAGLDDATRIFFTAYQENQDKPEAYKLAYERAYPKLDLDQKKVLDEQWGSKKSGFAPLAEKRYQELWDNSGLLQPTPDMKLEWERRLMNYRYRIQNQTDLDFYTAMAMKDVLGRYGISAIGGVSHWAKDAPELYGYNSAILNGMLERDLNEIGMTMKPEEPQVASMYRGDLYLKKSPYQLILDIDLELTRINDGYPVYLVRYKKSDGTPDYLRGIQGKLLEWPDRQTAEKCKALAVEKSKKIYEASRDWMKQTREFIQGALGGINQ